MVRFENVGMRYGHGSEVLQDVSFELKRGSFHFLTGPSGAGKSSLLRLLYMARRPSRGLITLFGQDISTAQRSELSALRRRVGVVFQDFRLFEHMTAIENTALPLMIAGATKSEVREHVEELLCWVGLEGRMDARPSTLSGGEKQRLAIARAVINRPDLLLADEPTGNVDPEMGQRLIHLFLELNKLGTTTVIATHDTSLVSSIEVPELRLNDGTLTVIEGSSRVV